MNRAHPALAALAALALPLALGARDDKKDPSKSGLPLQLKVLAKKDAYKSELTSQELKKLVEMAEKTGKYPNPPEVDLVLQITNRSDKELSFWNRGDPVKIGFELKGPGAVPVKPMLAFTTDFRAPEATKLAPGKTYEIPVKSLRFGFRGASEMVFWTDPGEYTLTANYATALSPAPEGLTKDESGFARVTLVSEPVKIKVEKK
jgi:hypothetical protein